MSTNYHTLEPSGLVRSRLQHTVFREEQTVGSSLVLCAAICFWGGRERPVSLRLSLTRARCRLNGTNEMCQDLISVLGGGERVGEEALRQALELAERSAADNQRPEVVAAQVKTTSMAPKIQPALFCGMSPPLL